MCRRHSWSHVRAPCPTLARSSVRRRPVQPTKGKLVCIEQSSLPVLAHSWQHLGHNRPTARRGENTMAKMMKTAERALHKRTNKMLASATKRYKKFMRQAAKAASDYKREEYLAAALSALVVTGVVASKLMANLEGKEALPQVLQGKNVKRRQNNRHAREDVDELRASPRSRRRSAR